MGRYVQILLSVICLLSLTVGSPPTTKGDRADIHFSNPAFVVNASPKSMSQTASGKKRTSRKRRRTPVPSKSKNSTTTGTGSQGTAPQQIAPTPTQPPVSHGPLSQMTYELPLRKPDAGEEQAQGLLTGIDCDAKGVTFNITVSTQKLKLRTPDLNSIYLITYAPDVSGEVTCGPRNPSNNVVIIYRPAEDARAKFNGDLVAVEFVPKNFELKK